jgi:hypothetical protein
VIEKGGEPVLRITTAATAPVEPLAAHGDRGRRLGWWSHRFESRIPAWLLGAVAESVAMPLVIASLLCGGAVENASVAESDGIIAIRWTDERKRVQSSVTIDSTRPGAVTVSQTAAVSALGEFAGERSTRPDGQGT